MKFEAEMPSGAAIVIGYDEKSVTVNNQRYTSSVLFGSHLSPQTWEARGLEEQHALQTAQALIDAAPSGTELVLLGTGSKQVFPPISARKLWMNAKLTVEVMDTAAACRTYNILLAEGRPVMAALIVNE